MKAVKKAAVSSIALVPLVVALTSCSSSNTPARTRHDALGAAHSRARGATSTSTVATTTTTAAPTTTTTVAPTTTAPHAASTTTPTTAPPRSSQSAPVPAASAASGGQLITVTASGYGTTVASFDAYDRSASGAWQLVYGPWEADVGESGMAPPGQKREGDGRTPSGTYGFGFFFGDVANPGGFQFPWREATSSDYWDDDPSSADYNQWVDESTQGAAAAGAKPEPMFDEPSYDYGAVIDYNMNPVVPGAGSAIFLHVSTGGPTAGCVSLPTSELLAVLRWLDPSEQPEIQTGVG